MIQLQHITKRYGAKTALQDVCFDVAQGQTLGLLGQNGAGKTTLLNILTGYIAPTQGRVVLDGRPMDTEPLAAKARLGYLPEQVPLYDEMTVSEYLFFVCHLRLVSGSAVEAHAREAATLAGAMEVWNRRIGNLSKGYRQRVGMAQALCGNPEILVLDEPTSGLDPRQTVEFREMIRKLSAGRTVIFSSHVLSEVQAVCSRVIILHEGRVVCDRALRPGGEGVLFLRLEVPKGAEALLPALRGLQSVLRANTVHTSAGSPSELFSLECKPGEQTYRELMNLLCARNIPILSLQNTGNSLEDIFLRCTSA